MNNKNVINLLKPFLNLWQFTMKSSNANSYKQLYYNLVCFIIIFEAFKALYVRIDYLA